MVQIREMNMNDYWEVFDLWSNTDGMGLSEADSEESIESFLTRNDGHSYVCIDGEKIIGTVLCGHDGRRGFLYHVAVLKEYRKSGIGKGLVESVLHSLKKAGIMKCHLMVYENNVMGNQYWNNSEWKRRNDILIYSKDTKGEI
ncbi:GNAT family N-acetyltransferase [Paenibacillus sp. CMAA1364]